MSRAIWGDGSRRFADVVGSSGQDGSQWEELARVLDEIAAVELLDRAAAVESVCATHPELAQRIRRLVPMLAALDVAGSKLAAGGSSRAESSRAEFAAAAGDRSALPATNEGPSDAVGPDRMLGDFRLLRVLGRGGMGVVYLARQVSLDRLVAVKVLPAVAMFDPRALARFKNEALAAASLEHPHIVSPFSVGSLEGVHYYAMRYIDGPSLADVITLLWQTRRDARPLAFHSLAEVATQSRAPANSTAQGSLDARSTMEGTSKRDPEDRAGGASRANDATRCSFFPPQFFRSVAELIAQVADALEHAHGQGIVHRDIKPSNLLLDGDGTPYVADFGVARMAADGNLTTTGDVMGTLRYMSPEQALGKRGGVDHRGDVYALGATLYELLTLRPAFDEREADRLLRQIAQADPLRARELNAAIPSDLENIVLRCLEKDRNRRYDSAAALADDLRCFARGEPVSARPVGRLERAWRWCRRQPALATAAGLAVAATLATIVTLAVSVVTISKARDDAFTLAGEKANLAQSERKAAEEARDATAERDRQLRLANARRLAAESRKVRELYPVRGTLLALEAIAATSQFGEPIQATAEDELQASLGALGGVPLVPHNGERNALTISSCGRWLVSADRDHSLWVVDFRSEGPRQRRNLPGHAKKVLCTAIRPQGDWLYSSGEDMRVRSWELAGSDADGPDIASVDLFTLAETPRVLFTSPDGNWLACGCGVSDPHGWRTCLYDLSKPIGPANQPRWLMDFLQPLAFSEDSRWLLAEDGARQLRACSIARRGSPGPSFVLHRRLATGMDLEFVSDRRWRIQGKNVDDERRFHFSLDDVAREAQAWKRGTWGDAPPGGQTIAISSVGNRPAGIFPDDRLSPPPPLSAAAQVGFDSGAPDTSEVSSSLKPRSLDHVREFVATARGFIGQKSISPDDRWLVVLDFRNSLHLWDIALANIEPTHRVLRAFDGSGGFFAFSPDSRWLLATNATEGMVRAWDLTDPNVATEPRCAKLRRTASRIVHLADQQHVLLGDGGLPREVTLLDLSTPNLSPVAQVLPLGNVIWPSALSPGGRWIAMHGHAPDGIAFCEWREGRLHRDPSWGVSKGKWSALTPDGEWRAARPGQGIQSIVVWDKADEIDSRVSRTTDDREFTGAHFLSSDARLVAKCGDDGILRVWRVTSLGVEPSPVEIPAVGPVDCIAFNPERSRIAIARQNNNGMIWLSRLDTNKSLSRIELATGSQSIAKMVFSQRGRGLIAATSDRRMLAWDMESVALAPRELACQGVHVNKLACSECGRWLIAIGNDGNARLWDLDKQPFNVDCRVLPGFSSSLNRISFPSGANVLVASCEGDPSVYAWRLNMDELVSLAKLATGRELTPSERRSHYLEQPPNAINEPPAIPTLTDIRAHKYPMLGLPDPDWHASMVAECLASDFQPGVFFHLKWLARYDRMRATKLLDEARKLWPTEIPHDVVATVDAGTDANAIVPAAAGPP